MDSWSAATAVSDRAEGLRAMSRKLLTSQRLRPACLGYLGCCKQRVVCCGSIPLAASWGRRLVGNFCSLLPLPLFFFFSLWPEEGRTSPASCWQHGNALLSHSLFIYLFILLFIRPQFIQTSILAASLKKVQWNSHFRLRLRYKQLHWCRYQSQNAVFDFWRVLPPQFCFLFS